MKQVLEELQFDHLPTMSELTLRAVKKVEIWEKHVPNYTIEKYKQVTRDYAIYITRPLTKSMFVPCGKDRVLFESTIDCDIIICDSTEVGWINSDDGDFEAEFETIEQAINSGVNLKLKQP